MGGAAVGTSHFPLFAPPPSLNGVKTMSSVEIVEVINALRGSGKAELRHDNFVAKVESRPGISHLNFQGTYSDPQGKLRPCYYLPKREAELMVMSESLEVQTKVYDRLAELEAKVVGAFRLPALAEHSVARPQSVIADASFRDNFVTAQEDS